MRANYYTLFARMVRACDCLPSSARVDGGLKQEVRTRWFTWVDQRSKWAPKLTGPRTHGPMKQAATEQLQRAKEYAAGEATDDFFAVKPEQRTLFQEGTVKPGWIDAMPEPSATPLYTPNGV